MSGKKKKLFCAKWIIFLFLVFGVGPRFGVSAESGYNAGVESRTILQCTTTVLGRDLKYLAAKKPEVTCLEVKIHPGQETGWHTHSVPGYAYVVSGELTVEYAGGPSKIFKAGDAFAEVVDTPHNGKNKGAADVVLVAFFTGDQGVAFTKKQHR
jgi:quercetin dioxygenase-like cupin family protein